MTAQAFFSITAPALSLDGISKNFGELEVLRDISVQVAQGEILALLGTSGCGKSTLLNILSGLLKADQGSLQLEGQAAEHFDGWRRVAYMFQEDRLLPWRTVRSNVAFGLEGAGLNRAERLARADAALRLVELEAFAKAWPHQLSGGMRSRVALARSLVVEPSVLLMDEPFSKLDPQTRSQMHHELLRLQALKGMTIVFVTHDVEEAVVLADRVVVLEPRPGRIRDIVGIDLQRPRAPTAADVSEQVRQLRLKV
ncbi:ABC transporter ATP-binding protein [Pseudomonas caspiana]|uniref:Nitrate/sulfonate/bicarbonate ABC transporter ATP-binding protein n=1 Tax=Pseudomonas caspiana TaxID=1451454 RepID=A0A1Y3NWH1_9PSED|nr:ABC transporter ATP-binding protein [Pseudomonas caspiana]OUM71938.1 nitrate/sulfonate/bicarbonate ABC transporter ATP-binding protein [Pseudomonas caspiana]